MYELHLLLHHKKEVISICCDAGNEKITPQGKRVAVGLCMCVCGWETEKGGVFEHVSRAPQVVYIMPVRPQDGVGTQ